MDKYIKCDEKLIDKTMSTCNPYTLIAFKIRDLLENYPSSDVREVVKCDKCKYGVPDYNTGFETAYQYYCTYTNTYNSKYHFCGYGRKRV